MNDFVSFAGLDEKLLDVGSERVVQYANSSFCEAVNIPREEVVGQLLKDVDHLPFGDGVLSNLCDQVEQENEPVDYSTSYVNPTTGEQEHVEISVHPSGDGFQVIIEDRSEEHRIEKAFQQYVGSNVLEKLRESDERDFEFPERRDVIVMFADLRGFTRLSEELPPGDVRQVLNACFDRIIQVIYDYDGTVDKIIGDEIMAFFGAPLDMPDHTARALHCAVEIGQQHEQLRQQWKSEGKNMPPIGIGVQTGQAVVGNVGSRLQQDYTAIGPPVNLAARLCGAASAGEILTTSRVYENVLEQAGLSTDDTEYDRTGEYKQRTYGGKVEEVETPEGAGQVIHSSQYAFRWLDRIRVKGIDDPIQVLSVNPGEQFEARQDFSSEQPDTEEETEGNVRTFGDYELLGSIGRGGWVSFTGHVTGPWAVRWPSRCYSGVRRPARTRLPVSCGRPRPPPGSGIPIL
ncbi:MAG: adenylate/guanylate cyclase domain-containing protein [bacterium]